MEGIRNGQYKNGATIVFDLLENNTANHASSEGKRILLDVMAKNKLKYKQTSGWGFEAWAGHSRSKRLTKYNGTSCFACHTSEKQSDYVFSQWRD